MKLKTMTRIAIGALYTSTVTILIGMILGTLGKLFAMAVSMGIGAIGIFIFELMSDRIDKWYEIHGDDKY